MNEYFKNAQALKNVLPSEARFCLVGGCFDLFHVGHIHLLDFAARLEPFLVVAVLSDRYISTYKKANRPIIPEHQRARIVAAIKCVSYVFISDTSPSSASTISLLQPSTVVFCDESGKEQRNTERILEIEKVSPGTIVKFLPRYQEEEVSTGHIINKISTGGY